MVAASSPKRRGAAHHRVGDAGQRLDRGGDRHPGVDQRRPFGDGRRPGAVRGRVDADDADLGDGVGLRGRARRLEVDEGQRGREERGGHGEGVDPRTFVRYCSPMSNDRSYLSSAAGLLRPASRAAVVRVDRAAARTQVQVVGGGAGRAPSSSRASSTPRRTSGSRRPGVSSSGRSPPCPVRAGMPDPVDDTGGDALTIDDYLIEHPSSDGARPRQGRLDDGRRHPRRRPRRRRKAAPPRGAATSSSRSSTTSSR